MTPMMCCTNLNQEFVDKQSLTDVEHESNLQVKKHYKCTFEFSPSLTI